MGKNQKNIFLKAEGRCHIK